MSHMNCLASSVLASTYWYYSLIPRVNGPLLSMILYFPWVAEASPEVSINFCPKSVSFMSAIHTDQTYPANTDLDATLRQVMLQPLRAIDMSGSLVRLFNLLKL